MALRFNPPPNWPAPPEGFVPPAGWQPDPSWGPAPEGWELWVDDAVSGTSASSAPQATSAPQAGPGADPAWAPTQAVPTSSSPVADPTGQSASAPSGDFAGTAPMPSQAPMTGSASSASPYAANMDYAQAPTPYHNQGAPTGGAPASSWQPVDMGGGTPANNNKPIVKQWWFWTIIGVLVVALVVGIVVALNSGGDDDPKDPATSAQSKTDEPTDGPTSDGPTTSGPTTSAPNTTSSSGDQGTTRDNPADPATQQFTMKAGKYSSDPSASVDVSFGAVEWNVNDILKGQSSIFYEEPPSGKVYIRVPVTITYHGSGQFSSYDLSIDYVNAKGNTSEAVRLYDKSEFSSQDMPRDGGSATGYFIFLIDEADANSGVFAVSAFYNSTEMYMAAK